MKKPLQLKNWFFLITDPTNKEDILHKITSKRSIDQFDMDFQPFKVPGTLHSNVCNILELDPYFEDNMQKLEHYETNTLILVCEFHIKDLTQDHHQ